MAHPKSRELGASGGVSEISTNQMAALSGYGNGRGSAGSDSEMMGHRRFQSATMSGNGSMLFYCSIFYVRVLLQR